MALAPLATVADLTARGITVDSPAEDTLVDTLLAEASTIVRDAAGVPISQATSTVVLAGPRNGQWLPLPAPPIRDVTTVAVDGTTVTDWRLSAGRLWRNAGWVTDTGPSEITITMTHGYTAVPADIVGLVCSMVAAGLKAARAADDGTGLAARDPSIQSEAESVGSYSTSTTYATGPDAGATAPTAMALPSRTRQALRERFSGAAGMVTVR